MSGGGGNSGSQTVTTSQQIPAYEQQFSQENQNLARSLAAQPYPVYQGQMIADFTPQQTAGMNMVNSAATAYQPDLANAEAAVGNALGMNPLAMGAPLVGGGANTLQGALSMPEMQAAYSMLGGAFNPNAQYYQGNNLLGQSVGAAQPLVGQGASTLSNAAAMNPVASNNLADPSVIARFMSPYVENALAPQMLAAQTQLGQQQNQINAQATGANAFGDARQGVENALQNFYGNQTMAGIQAQGYNTAYENALQAAGQQAQLGLGEQGLQGQLGSALGQLGLGYGGLQSQVGQALGQLGLGEQGLQGQIGSSLGNLQLGQSGLEAQIGQALGNLGLGVTAAGQNEQQIGLQGGAELANLGQLQQQLGLQGAQALYESGAQQQQLQQQALNTAYTQFLNQVQWPYQMLSVRESALSNSPYNLQSSVTYPGANQTAQNLGAFAALAGGMGSLFGGGGWGSSTVPQAIR